MIYIYYITQTYIILPQYSLYGGLSQYVLYYIFMSWNIYVHATVAFWMLGELYRMFFLRTLILISCTDKTLFQLIGCLCLSSKHRTAGNHSGSWKPDSSRHPDSSCHRPDSSHTILSTLDLAPLTLSLSLTHLIQYQRMTMTSK
jgi:hypothetical protein